METKNGFHGRPILQIGHPWKPFSLFPRKRQTWKRRPWFPRVPCAGMRFDVGPGGSRRAPVETEGHPWKRFRGNRSANSRPEQEEELEGEEEGVSLLSEVSALFEKTSRRGNVLSFLKWKRFLGDMPPRGNVWGKRFHCKKTFLRRVQKMRRSSFFAKDGDVETLGNP